MAKSASEELKCAHGAIISRLLELTPLVQGSLNYRASFCCFAKTTAGENLPRSKEPPTVPTAALGLFQKINYEEFLPVQVIFPKQRVERPCYPAFKKPVQLNQMAVSSPDSSLPTSFDKVRRSHTLTDKHTPYLTARRSAKMKMHVRSPGLKLAQHPSLKQNSHINADQPNCLVRNEH